MATLECVEECCCETIGKRKKQRGWKYKIEYADARVYLRSAMQPLNTPRPFLLTTSFNTSQVPAAHPLLEDVVIDH